MAKASYAPMFETVSGALNKINKKSPHARDGFKHRGIRCFCHDFRDYGLRVMGYGTFFRVAFTLRLLAVLLYVVETKRDDFEDDVHKDLFPILFFFFFHKSKITKNDSKII